MTNQTQVTKDELRELVKKILEKVDYCESKEAKDKECEAFLNELRKITKRYGRLISLVNPSVIKHVISEGDPNFITYYNGKYYLINVNRAEIVNEYNSADKAILDLCRDSILVIINDDSEIGPYGAGIYCINWDEYYHIYSMTYDWW